MGCSCGHSEHLMCTNVGDMRLKEKGRLLLIGSCMSSRYPDIVEKHREKNGGYAVLSVCLEETHANQAGFKIGSIVRYSQLDRLTVLTVDGSPHCVQLHFLVEDIKRHFTPEVETDHYVVEKGVVHQVSAAAVKRARHLSKIIP
ncbi:MAG: 4Fe-4S ferredoxin [Candidatus Thorarchaeota archaeon]